ncbi:MAG: SDR family oxidoreductase [Bythopirellula sp.]
MTRKFLVTGGAGFIGSHIATALIERGDEVVVLDNFQSGRRENLAHLGDQVQLLEASVTDLKQVETAVRGVEVVYHQAALASVPMSIDKPLDANAVCVTGTVNVLDAARRAGVRRVVFAASSSAYGNEPTPIKCETDLPAVLSPYAAAKLAGEAYCQAFAATYGLETVALRYFNVFGPRQDPQSEYSAVIPIFVSKMVQGERPIVFGDGGQSRDFVYIDNVVQANLAAADATRAVGRTINVGCGRQFNLLQLIQAINKVLETDIQPVFEKPRAGDVRESLADISLACDVLDYEPQIDFDEGLRRSIEYYLSLVPS